MQTNEMARTPLSLPAGQGNGRRKVVGHTTLDYYSPFRQVVLQVQKRDRLCKIGKLVVASPMNEIVFGTPYRNRQTVKHVSLPPVALNYAKTHGAKHWVVRLDTEGRCFSLPLAKVEEVGWLKLSHGWAELFVPLSKFAPLPWQDWPFVLDVITLTVVDEPNHEPLDNGQRQLDLFGEAS